MEIRYSVIVPIYNVEKYLVRCLDSILAQTYQNFELILIDDGSTDISGRVADLYFERNPERVVVKHQKNQGLGGARNTGILLARGEYLVFIDSDDYISEKMLETVDQYIRRYNNDILIFDYVMEEEDGSQQIIHLHQLAGYHEISTHDFLSETPAAWNKVYKASLFKETDIRYPERIYYEDVAVSPCFAIHASNIGAIDKPLYYYIQRNASIIHTKNTSRMLEICTAVEISLNYFKKMGYFEEYYQELEYLTVKHILCAGVQRIILAQYDQKKIKKLERFVEGYFPAYQKNPYVRQNILKADTLREKMIIRKRHLYLYVEYILKKIVKNLLRVGKGWLL